MTLASGARLGPYEILSPLGVGGMGEVYRAHDTRLKRDVAIKILPETFARDSDRRARFRREAELLATLNHPHIAAVYGLEEDSGLTALVLELVEGPTLADRLDKGPIPIHEALPIARQIAEALEAAHDRGIIHRDLKPANIKLRRDGTVKVLDFGLAKSLEPTGRVNDLTQSPSVMSPAPTLAGVILGTAAYMAPEQARGKAVDKRTDIWAFGCVLYEMLTGQKAFQGDTLTDTMAAILKSAPEWRALPHGTPVRVQSLIARCLRKDPTQRLHDMADVRIEIEEVLNDPSGSVAVVIPGRAYREWAGWIVAALLLGVALFFAGRPSTTGSSGDGISFAIFPPEKTVFSSRINTTINVPSFALSPDGHVLVFSAAMPDARPMLWMRAMDHADARQLPGTEDAQDPFWSPDSRWIGFFADGMLRKIPAAGGAVQVITQARSDFRGATWGADDTILFASGLEPIVSLNAAGGPTKPVTVIDTSRHLGTHRNPHLLPDGHHFLYSIIGFSDDQSGVYVGSLDGQTKKLLVHANTSAVYAAPGYVLFVDGDTLLGQAFDADRLELKGQPFLVAEHVGRTSAYLSAVSASATGTIAYAGRIAQNGHLTWLDRKGSLLGPAGIPQGEYVDFRLSPDGTRLAASLLDPKTNVVDIWITDLVRGSTFRVGAGGSITNAAVWSPDGTRLLFRSNRQGMIQLYERSAAGGGVDRPLLSLEAFRAAQLGQNLIATDWSSVGSRVICSAPTLGSGNDLWLVPVGNDGKPTKLIASPA
jgi:serine/threonine protein kinase